MDYDDFDLITYELKSFQFQLTRRLMHETEISYSKYE